MSFERQPVVRVSLEPGAELPEAGWPMSVPAVAQLLRDGLDLSPGVTFLVGENGSGKSTIVEAVAMAYGLSPEGGSSLARHQTRPTESPLAAALRVRRGVGSSRWGFFLRAETMHGFYTYLEDHPGARPEPRFHEMSHGESFLAVLEHRFSTPGFYCLDEPEAALSFSSTLALIGVLQQVTDSGGQVLAPPTPRCWPRCPAPPSSKSASGACAAPTGRTWNWCSTGGRTWRRRSATCATSSIERSAPDDRETGPHHERRRCLRW